MIDYSPFWATVERTGNNWYTLANKFHVPNSTLHRLKHNMDVSTKTLNDLCRILNCNICDIVQYIPSDDDQILQMQTQKTNLSRLGKSRALKIVCPASFFIPLLPLLPFLFYDI